ncbi:SdpI family protein [Patescibacteria group bacterium]|nr:SdpI family protein [Patescibacteria group bacterium]
MKSNKALFLIAWLLVICSFALAAYFYPILPNNIVSHWNSIGQPNGYMPRSLGSFTLPVISLFILLIFTLIPYIDPLKANIKEFIGYYHGFMIVFMIFMLSIQLQVMLWNTGVQVATSIVAPAVAFGILLFYAGIMTEHTKRNWFIGVRTPWTISNDQVWEKTNRLGGKLFKLCGIIAAIGAIFGMYAILLIAVPIIASAVFLVIYSYILFSKDRQVR